MDNLDNPYYNNVAQAVELVACMDQTIEMLGRVKPRPEPLAEIKPHACRGVGTVEVPRGTLWHEYELDDTGHIKHANIITPTAQNLRSINDDLRADAAVGRGHAAGGDGRRDGEADPVVRPVPVLRGPLPAHRRDLDNRSTSRWPVSSLR